MHFAFEAPVTGPLANPDDLVTLVSQGEALGFDMIHAGDHIVIPGQIKAPYPYTQSGVFTGSWTLEPGATHFLEQLTTLMFLAAHSSKIRLLAAVMVVPYRSPVHTAKIIATIDILSRGRLDLGCGLGWMQDEFEALGAPPFNERGAVTDEYLSAFKELWTSEEPTFEGKYVRFSDIRFEPKPFQRPHPPLWIGGESEAAMRRAARLGDVWYPLGNNPRYPLGTPAKLSEAIGRLRSYAEETDRDPSEIRVAYSAEFWYSDREATYLTNGQRRIFTGAPEEIAEDIYVFEELGVSSLTFNFNGDTLTETLERLERFAKEVRPLVQ